MGYIPLEKLIGKDKELYKTILVAAARANELAQGAHPLIQTTSKKVSSVALEELAAGKVTYEAAKKSATKKLKE